MRNDIVLVNGCFDILHAGHVDLLEVAASMGTLVVAINSDDSIRALKGPRRPIMYQTERAKVLNSIRYVDRVVAFDGETCEDVISEYEPRLWVKGAGYTRENVNQNELSVLEDNGGRLVIVPAVYQVSTTLIVNRIREGYE